MIAKERVEKYINSLGSNFPHFLLEIENEAIKNYVPIIRKSTQEIMKHLMVTQMPNKILEVGTAVGFSALLMREYAPTSKITTIENYPPRIEEATRNFMLYDTDNRIKLLEGDASEWLEKLDKDGEKFDFIFMDAAKAQYMNWMPYLMNMINVGGTIVSDNVLQDGDIIESRYAVTKRNRTIHSRMREYMYYLTHEESLSTIIIPSGDGLTISKKIK